MSDTQLNEVEVFLPAPGPVSEADDPQEFLEAATDLAEQGYPITIYVRGEDDWAFEQCEPVAEILDINGDDALPITLLGPDIMGMYAYPSAAKLKRLSETPTTTPKQATNACTPSAPARKNSPIAGLLRLDKPEPDAPDIGGRRNLMGGDTGDGLPDIEREGEPRAE